MNRIKGFWNKGAGPKAVLIVGSTMALLILFSAVTAIFSSSAEAAEPSDNGVWASPEGALQGFAVQYAPVLPPAVVYYWFTYDEDGNQAWFISDNVPVDSGKSEDMVDLFKPICTFIDDSRSCQIGDPVGVLAIGRSGDRISVRFGISTALEGFSEDCAQDIQVPVLPSPLPPEIPSEFGCRSHLMLSRISPAIPALTPER